MDASEMARYIRESFDGTRTVEQSDDIFFIYDPDRDLPPERQMPFATIVTGDRYDHVSNLDRPDTYRLNVGLTKATYTARFGPAPTKRGDDYVLETGYDYAAVDTIVPHPFYASQYWVGVVNPGEATLETVKAFLVEAHAFAARKHARYKARREPRSGTAAEKR